VLSASSQSPLALELRSHRGARLGDVFAFISGLYFRGKLTYARRFAAPPDPASGSGIHVITTTSGLRDPDTTVTADALRAFAGGDIDPDDPGYRRPLEQSARALLQEIGPDCDIVLLGSIASPKYVDVLVSVFGERLRFPVDFVGRGDMSRGGLLLRKAAEGVELPYVAVEGATRRGARPPKLQRLR